VTAGQEAAFWDDHVPSTEELLAAYSAGPDKTVLRMFEILGIGQPGRRILDFACGGGVTSMWMRDRGATVVGVDVSEVSIARARELASAVGGGDGVTFRILDDDRPDVGAGEYDGIFGHYALHHVDIRRYGAVLRNAIVLGGSAAFYETAITNNVLRLARRALPGRFGIPRFSTDDERPLQRGDFDWLRMEFGEQWIEVPEMHFFRIFNRQVLRFRHPRLSERLARADDWLGRFRSLHRFSYHQIVVLRRTRV